MPQFEELRNVNKTLGEKTMKKIPKLAINKFLTGKEQNIHTNYKNEFLSYCSNAAFDWDMDKNLKKEYYNTLKNSGLFNMESEWWSKRFR
jgi:hypothetical protein